MPDVTGRNLISIAHSANGESDNFATTTAFYSNTLVKFKIETDANIIHDIDTSLETDDIKYIGIQADQILSKVEFLNSSGSVVFDTGTNAFLVAGEVVQFFRGDDVDGHALPNAGADNIAKVRIRKANSSDTNGEVVVEVYVNNPSDKSTP